MKRFVASVAIAAALICVRLAPAIAQFASPGIVSLGDFQISAAGNQVTPQNLQMGSANGPSTLPGMTALSCQVRFNYGAGGTQTNVFIQTSLDQGQSWFDIANVQFTTTPLVEVINLSGLTGVTTPTPPVNQALTANTTFNGPLGDRLQAVVVSTGTYSGGTLASVRCSPR